MYTLKKFKIQNSKLKNIQKVYRVKDFLCKLNSKFKSGQTIIEVLVSLTLIIFFLSGIAVIQLTATKNITFSQRKSTATELARQQLERARVIRDSIGIGALYNSCFDTLCYIGADLTPVPVTPTGEYGQSFTILLATPSDCPMPEVTITPTPIIYKATVLVNWAQSAAITPAPEVRMSSCFSDWR